MVEGDAEEGEDKVTEGQACLGALSQEGEPVNTQGSPRLGRCQSPGEDPTRMGSSTSEFLILGSVWTPKFNQPIPWVSAAQEPPLRTPGPRKALAWQAGC